MKTPSKGRTKSTGRIKISDLARLAGISKSSIHLYLKMGLLHPPQKIGLNLSVYDSTHLAKLKRIHDLRKIHKIHLSKINEILSNENQQFTSSSCEDEAEVLISSIEAEKQLIKAHKTEKKKIDIMDAAISLFSKNGYEGTTIEDIAETLHMAKSTVYLYFESKDDLFMECIERLTVVAVPEEAWDEIRKERNILEKIKKRTLAFHKSFPSYKGILAMAKNALGGDNEKLMEKAKNTLTLMTRPIVSDLRKGMAEGVFREIDEELVAHAMLAMGEGLGCRQMMDSRYTIEQVVKNTLDLLINGLLKRGATMFPNHDHAACSGEVTDLKGLVTRVENIRFSNSAFLPAKFGEAEVQIVPQKVREVRFQQRDSVFWVEIDIRDGATERAEIDGSLTLLGEVPFGEFSIEIKNVASILFDSGEPHSSETNMEENAL